MSAIFLSGPRLCWQLFLLEFGFFPPKVKNNIQVVLPRILTLGNLAAGIGAVWCALNNRIGTGVLLIFAAITRRVVPGSGLFST